MRHGDLTPAPSPTARGSRGEVCGKEDLGPSLDRLRTLCYHRPMQNTTSPHGLLDLTGLPDEAIRAIESLVSLLKVRSDLSTPVTRLSPEEWRRRLLEWAGSHPQRTGVLDDSRESIYAGRGE